MNKQDELRKKIGNIFIFGYNDAYSKDRLKIDKIMQLIKEHTEEVIGEDEKPMFTSIPGTGIEVEVKGIRNELRAEQRERAGLDK